MKTFIKTLALAAILIFSFAPAIVRAQDDSSVSFQTFYDQLSSQGTWINTNDYGYVFQPTVNDPNWRPYTYGHWVDTDAGLTWVSDEPFGWATYHYGRWVDLDGVGWVWVPGYVWGPAWVSWRESDDYDGWAPLPPDTALGIDFYDGYDYFGFHIGGDCDTVFGIGPECYNFCPVAYIGDSNAWRHFRDRRDNFAFINRTRNVTNLNFQRNGAGRFGRVRAGGPALATLNARARTPIQQASLTSTSTLAANGHLRGHSLSVFAPTVDPATARTARPNAVSQTLATTTVNRGTDINRPLTVNSRIRAASPTAAQVSAATLAQNNVPANAQVATSQTRFSRTLNRPLTSLQPNARSAGVTANTGASATGTGAQVQSNATAGPTHIATPTITTEPRFTGEPAATRHTATPTVSAPSVTTESRFSGEPATRHITAPATTSSTSSVRSFNSEVSQPSVAPVRHTQPSYQSSAPVFHSAPAPVFHSQSSAPAFHASAPVFHSAPAPVVHSQPSVRSFAPAPRSGGGAPAAHSSGGNAQSNSNNQRH